MDSPTVLSIWNGAGSFRFVLESSSFEQSALICEI